MLNTERTKAAEIIEPVEASATSRAVTSARRKPELSPLPAGPQPAADQHPAFVYLASLAPGSRRGVRSSLQVCAELLSSGRCDWQTLPWQGLGPQHTQALRSELADRYAAATANKMLASVRGVLRAAWELGQIDTDRYQRAIGFRAVRGQTLPRGRSISQGELRALFSNCLKDKTPLGVRDAALLAVLYGSGLRRAEVTALDVADYDRETASLTIRAGKGNKARVSYTSVGERQLLEAWLKVREQEGAPAASGPLFLPVLKGGHVKLRRLDSRTILVVAQRRAKAAGCKHLTPHDFRRTMISDLLDAGADPCHSYGGLRPSFADLVVPGAVHSAGRQPLSGPWIG
ncbi:MAG: tyrosine-type recombinase/integrase [Chloroflexota bacterium]